MRRPLPLLLLLAAALPACRDACEQRCFDLKDFYEACGEDLEHAGHPVPCYDEGVEAYPDGTVDREHRRECDDGRDARQSCLRVSHARAQALAPADNDARLAECQEGTDFDDAVAALDCDAAVEALDARPQY